MVKGFRRKGLMMAIDLHNPEQVQQLFQNCLENGVLVFWFLSCPDSFRLAPPLTISESEIKKACEVIVRELEKIRVT
jgi:acetylornithine/succinyldiaminopimelate/putrescine aminotransferase